MADQVYTPQTIQDTPFPSEVAQPSSNPSNSGGGEIYTPQTIPEKSLPRKIYAHETISQALNTKSQKIIKEFSFTKYGALQIGEYSPNVSGDIRISQDGFVARNKGGETTVGIDGDTGDAVFKGTLKAGTVIAGDDKVILEEVDGNGRIVLYDNNNVPSIVIGALD